MGSSWHQIALKIDLQIDDKNDSISDRSWDRFWSILGPNLEPKSAQDFPTWSQDRPKTPPRPLQDLPKPTQEQSKIDPKSKSYFWSVLESNFVDFSSIFDPKIVQKSIKIASFSLIFDSFFDWIFMDFDSHFGLHFIDFARILEFILVHFKSISNQIAEGEGRRWPAAGAFNR